jgi:hypothetical protein
MTISAALAHVTFVSKTIFGDDDVVEINVEVVDEVGKGGYV